MPGQSITPVDTVTDELELGPRAGSALWAENLFNSPVARANVAAARIREAGFRREYRERGAA